MRLPSVLIAADELAFAAGVNCIIDSGTLLGLTRDNNLLPGDTDIDLSIAELPDFQRLVANLHHDRKRIFQFRGMPYKLEIEVDVEGTTWLLDVKCFRKQQELYYCPAIGARASSTQSGSEPKYGWRRHLRPAWRTLMNKSDAAYPPLNWLARIDAWVVPSHHFDDTRAFASSKALRMPADVDRYLQYRYGKWEVPAEDWVSWRDDGGYRRNAAAELQFW